MRFAIRTLMLSTLSVSVFASWQAPPPSYLCIEVRFLKPIKVSEPLQYNFRRQCFGDIQVIKARGLEDIKRNQVFGWTLIRGANECPPKGTVLVGDLIQSVAPNDGISREFVPQPSCLASSR